MSVAKALQNYLIGAGLMSANNSFVSRMPSVDLSSSDQWAIVAGGGSKSGGNILQWKSTHNLLVLYRHKDGEELYNKDDALNIALAGCTILEGYRVLRCIVNPMTELELAAKEIHVGQWAVTLELVTKDEES